MGDKTGIEWTDATWNPTTGCDRTSPGCDNCYALDMAKRLKAMGVAAYQNDGDGDLSGPGFGLTMHADRLDQPLRWKRPRRIFVDSMSDLFHVDVTAEFQEQVFDVMGDAEQHTFQVLTKRTQIMANWTIKHYAGELFVPHPNVWLGTSIENDRYAFRANHLRRAKAAVRFLSLEPLLGPLPSLDLTGIDWVIVGGESGPHARPMHPEWARDIRDRCVGAGIPFLFKQWGNYAPHRDRETVTTVVSYDGKTTWGPTATNIPYFERRCASMVRHDKHAAGRELDGRTWDEYPA